MERIANREIRASNAMMQYASAALRGRRFNPYKAARNAAIIAGIILSADMVNTHIAPRIREHAAPKVKQAAIERIAPAALEKALRKDAPSDAGLRNEKLASGMYANILVDLKYEGKSPSPMLSKAYLEEVIKEARVVSERLNIPFKFVISDWLMEIGKLSTDSNRNIEFNNLANLGYEGGQGRAFVLKRFSSLAEFGDAYVHVMMKAGAAGMIDPRQIVERMREAGYFTRESTESYLSKVEGVMILVENRKYDPYKSKSG